MSAAAGIALRPLRWWDVEAVQALDAQLFGPAAWTPAMFWSELAAGPTRWYVVAESAGPDEQIGTAGALAGYAGLLVPEIGRAHV